MSERASAPSAVRRPRWAARVRPRVLEIVWLTFVWVLLWGTFSPLSIVGGVVVAVAVIGAFRFPPAEAHLPVRPLRLLLLVGYLVYDMVVSGAEVSWQVLRYGPAARGAVFEVPLLSSSDRVVTVVANALSLSPGAMTLQIDHAHGLWFVYALGPRDGAGVERSRRRTMDMQRRVLAALGTPEELATAERLLAERGC
ncbi:MAG: Na+/H+ antiporter subunit E [Pseudonocardia sp.]|nr:Na+/H+ antiporter subunit E [Pseudonocardia sp.]